MHVPEISHQISQSIKEHLELTCYICSTVLNILGTSKKWEVLLQRTSKGHKVPEGADSECCLLAVLPVAVAMNLSLRDDLGVQLVLTRSNVQTF